MLNQTMATSWDKVLYKTQNVPDNFVSPQFLSELRKNLYVRKYSLCTLIIDAGCVYQQLCCIVTFVTLYLYLLLDWISPTVMLAWMSILLMLGYCLFWYLRSDDANRMGPAFELRTGAIIFVYTFLLAPILHSLLGTVSTDTIYALATIFLFLNWAFLDYTTQSDEFSYKPGSNTTALSSSLLAALCLASRLATSYHTFVLIAAATTLFILWPLLVRTIRLHAGRKGQIFLTFFTCIVSNIFLGALAYYETTVKHQLLLAFTSILIAFCLNFLGPWLLVRMQRMKRNIHGPWDEAVAQS